MIYYELNNNIGKKFRQERSNKTITEEYIEVDYVNTKPPAIFIDGNYVIINRYIE